VVEVRGALCWHQVIRKANAMFNRVAHQLSRDTFAEVIFKIIEIAPSEPEMALTVAASNLIFIFILNLLKNENSQR
jgi:hypothetical protein